MLRNLLSSLLLMLALVSCHPLQKVETVEPANHPFAWVENIIDSTMAKNNIPALSVGIVEKGRLIYAKGFGRLHRDREERANEQTIYQIGSDTKKMTAIIAKHLAEEGIINMEESIVPLLGDRIPDSTKTKLKAVTMAYLLTHKAGIPYRAPSNERVDGHAMTKEYSETDLLTDLNAIQLRFTPGSKFGYSNLDYAIAGYLCELASNRSYAQLIDKYISKPYAMSHTSLSLHSQQKSMLATPYRKDDRNTETQPWTMGKLAPAGGVYSNIADLSKLMIQQIKVYQDYSQRGDMSSPLFLTMDDKEKEGHYGLGLGKSVDADGVRYGHGGDLDGYASGYVFSPQKDRGLILLTSSGGKWFGKMEKTIQTKLFQ
ncbi:MAG: serine hydrolase domain-containing protein [Bacteroidota bacterium]